MACARRLDLIGTAAPASIAVLANVAMNRIHAPTYPQPEAQGQQPDTPHATRMAWLHHRGGGRSMAQVMLATMIPWEPSFTESSCLQLQGKCAAAQQVDT